MTTTVHWYRLYMHLMESTYKGPFNNYVTPRRGGGVLSDALRTVVNTTLKSVMKGGGGVKTLKTALRNCWAAPNNVNLRMLHCGTLFCLLEFRAETVSDTDRRRPTSIYMITLSMIRHRLLPHFMYSPFWFQRSLVNWFSSPVSFFSFQSDIDDLYT